MRWILGSVALAIVLLLAFVVLEQNPAQAVAEGYYYTGTYEKPGDLNPFTTVNSVTLRYVLPFTHDALMDWDPESGAPREALATVEPNADGVTYLFTLRDGVRFADGTPVTLEDLLFTWEVCADPGVPTGAMGSDLARVREATILPGAPARLKVVLAERYFAGLDAVGPSWRVVQKQYFLDEVARLAGRPVLPGEEGFGRWLAMVELPGPGSGPYQIEERVSSRADSWQSLRELRLVQNPESWRRQACQDCWQLDGFRLLFISDPDAKFTHLLDGNLGWYYDPDPAELLAEHPELAEKYQAYEYDYRNLGHYWIVWNAEREPFDNVEVRRALSMVFDREAIVDVLLAGKGEVATAYFKPGTESYPREDTVPFDPQAARLLLQQAGFGPGGEPLRVEVLAPVEDPFYRRVLDMAVPAFRDAGIELVPHVVTFALVLQRIRERDFDGAFVLKSHGAWVDPYPTFHSSQAGSGQNFMGYSNPEVDRILDAARVEMSDGRRLDLFRRFNTIIQQEQPVTFLAHPRASMLIDRRIQGVEPGPLGLFQERWWVSR